MIRAQFKATPIVSPAFVLTVVDGPDVGKSFRVDDGAGRRVLVGQSPVCEVRLSDKTVSRRHVALEVDGAALRIVDQGSSNGTSVSGVRVRDAYLRNGELVVIGSTTLRVDLDRAERVRLDANVLGGIHAAAPVLLRWRGDDAAGSGCQSKGCRSPDPATSCGNGPA